MNYLILIFLSFNVYASSFIKKNNINKCYDVNVFTKQKYCGENCIKIDKNYNCNYSILIPETQIKEDVEICSDQENCELILSEKECTSPQAKPIYTLDPNEVYCTWTRPEHIGIDQAKKSAYEANKLASEQEKAAIDIALKSMECGKKVKALVLVRNAPKNLSKGQVKQMLVSYSEIDSLLESGSLVTAKDEIQNIVADGVLITEQDKAALISKIDSCLN